MPEPTLMLIRYSGDPVDHWTPIDASTIRYALLWNAVEAGHVHAPWTTRIALGVGERGHVLVSTADGRIAVTEHKTIARFMSHVGDRAFVHANHSVVVNVPRIDRFVRRDGYLLYLPRGAGHPEERETIDLSRNGKRFLREALSGRRSRPEDPRPPTLM